jgi:hypothetical protein
MKTEFPVAYNIHDLTVRGYTLGNIYNSLVQNLSGSIEDTILPAVSDPTKDQSSFSPWFDGASWHVWDDARSAYKPTSVIVGNVSLDASPTANRTHQVQNKDGVIALIEDVYNTRGTITLQEGLVSVDWDMSDSFRVILSGNRSTALYMTHSKPGREIMVILTNSGTNQVVGTWDPVIKWPGATAPSMPASTPGASKSVMVNLVNLDGVIYGEYLNFEHSSVPAIRPGTPSLGVSV